MSKPESEPTYDTTEARDIIQRAEEELQHDAAGRKEAAWAMFGALVELTRTTKSPGLRFTPNPRGDGFYVSYGQEQVWFGVNANGEVVFGDTPARLTGLDYNPKTKVFEGPVVDKSTWPPQRRDALGYLAETVLTALHVRLYPRAPIGDINRR